MTEKEKTACMILLLMKLCHLPTSGTKSEYFWLRPFETIVSFPRASLLIVLSALNKLTVPEFVKILLELVDDYRLVNMQTSYLTRKDRERRKYTWLFALVFSRTYDLL